MVQITPEMQAQLDEAKKNCPFCKIIKGEIPGSKVYSNDLITAILDIHPWVKGHVLLMPKEHYPIMPYLPPDLFKHMFGKLPKFIKAIKTAMISTGANIVIANGAVAGQQSPHFLIHLLPRDEGDGFDKYGFEEKKDLDKEKFAQAEQMLTQNIPLMMGNHFKRNPASWRKSQFTSGVYEDEKVICTIAENPQCIGHLKLIPKGFNEFEDMDEESAAHLFFTASFCATAVFEGLGAQGSNIILKTGNSNDNTGLSLHILPRYPDDGLDLIGTPMTTKPDSNEIAKKIKDETFIIDYEEEKKPEPQPIQKRPAKNSAEEEINAAMRDFKEG